MMEGSGVIKDDIDDNENSEYYDLVMIPHCSSEEKKNGITFKGDTAEYLRARDIIFDFFNKKGRKLTVNNRNLQILDIVKYQFKIEVKPPKGQTGKINIKIYPANKSGIATFMITKTKDSELVHVKTLAFKVIKYLIDGIIDGVINENDVNSFKSGEDEGLEKRKLICQFCSKDFKTKNGISIHMDKEHGMLKQNKCDFCGKNCITETELGAHIESEHSLKHKKSCHLCGDSFQTENDHNEHIKKKHEPVEEFECDKCKFKFQDLKVLSEHTAKCGENETNNEMNDFQVKCDYCDLKVAAENEVNAKHTLSQHLESCSFVPKQHEVGQKFVCKKCGFTTKQENVFKRHKRDIHEKLSASTSPKPKKRKESPNVEFMEVDELDRDKQLDNNEMEVDDQSDTLSKMWDEKIQRKNEKNKQEEHKLLKEKEEKKKNEVLKKEAEKKEAEKQKRMRTKLKRKDKKERAEKMSINPYLKELPEAIKNIIGDNYLLYPVAGDGACALRAIAGWIFQDPSLGPYLGRNVNEHFVKNWHYWENFFTFPIKRSMGVGGPKVFKNSGELFEFLRNAVDGAFMWRDHQDLAAISNIFKVKIKIITVENEMDSNPIIHIQEPDPDFKIVNDEFPPGKVPDMVLYHVKNVHYDLIVPKDSILAKEGGLDFQRKQNVELLDENQKQNDDVKESEELTLQRKISRLEGLLKVMDEKVKKLEAEKANRIVNSQYICFECDETFKTKECVKKHMETHNTDSQKFEIKCEQCDLKYQSQKLLEDHVKTHDDCSNTIDKEKFKCDDCNSQFTSKEYLENHMAKHNKNKCTVCGTCFWSERQLETHVKEIHKDNEHQADPMEVYEQYNCINCGEIFTTKEQLEKHISSDHKSKPYYCVKCKSSYITKKTFEEHLKSHSDYEYTCQHCEGKYKTKVQMKNHALEKHGVGVGKQVKQFNCTDCSFQGDTWSQLKNHIQILGHNPVEYSERCYTCKQEFSSYWKLMTHRKVEHPSNKRCRYYLKQQCYFNNETCWYRHEMNIKEVETQFECRECDDKFLKKNELMVHKKKKHREITEKCRDYLQGNCKETEETCWFIHEMNKSSSYSMETEELPEDYLGFQKVGVKAPPDQLKYLIEMINKHSVKIESLEKKTLIGKQ